MVKIIVIGVFSVLVAIIVNTAIGLRAIEQIRKDYRETEKIIEELNAWKH